MTRAMKTVVAAAAAMVLSAGMAGQAQRGRGAAPTALPPPPGMPNMFGAWLPQDPGSGSWQEWFDNVPAPSLRPAFIKMNQDDQARLDAGNVTNANTTREEGCVPGVGLAQGMASSGAKEALFLGDKIQFSGRSIYLDGRRHPDTKSAGYRPESLGHSIGRWEGDILVIDTIGFPAKTCDSRFPLQRVPNGGRAKETTRLTERFRLVDPDTLQVTFTWEDPDIYLKPHMYSYTYKRIVLPSDDPAHPAPKRQFLTDKYWER